MPPANIDATVVILDLGVKGSYDLAYGCVTRLLERKIISRPKDLIAVILLGSKRTKNHLAEASGAFKRIEMLSSFEAPNWKLMREIPQEPTNRCGDWFEALIVAADMFKNELYGTKVTNKKVVLVTDFASPVSIPENVEQVLNGFQDEEYEVNVIGPDIYSEKLAGPEIDLIRKFVDMTAGVATTYENAMSYLLFHRKKTRNPLPWNVDLKIGPNINIPVSVYSRIREDQVINKWNIAVKDAVTTKSSESEAVFKQKEYFKAENQNTVSENDVITGYLYGDTAIPFTESDKSMLYESGQKSLVLYGFTDSENIKWHNLSGNGVSYLFGRKDIKNSHKVVKCLAQCLIDLNVVGIARRVYNNGNAPTMFAMFPVLDKSGLFCISLVALNYKEDIKNMAFPSTSQKQYEPSDEQVEVFKQLIESMNLMDAYDDIYDDKEAFPIAETVNPSVQYVLDCIAYKAMQPTKSLPPPRDDIKALFEMPHLVHKRSQDYMEKIKGIFDIKEVKKMTRKNNLDAKQANSDILIPNAVLADENPVTSIKIDTKPNYLDDEITYIGTVNPAKDFNHLISKGKDLVEIALETTSIIETLVYLSHSDDYTKVIEILRCFRNECVKDKPDLYNNWLKEFKKGLLERRKDAFLRVIIDEMLNFITKVENENSSVSTDDIQNEDPAYDIDTVPNSTNLSLPLENYEFFDDM